MFTLVQTGNSPKKGYLLLKNGTALRKIAWFTVCGQDFYHSVTGFPQHETYHASGQFGPKWERDKCGQLRPVPQNLALAKIGRFTKEIEDLKSPDVRERGDRLIEINNPTQVEVYALPLDEESLNAYPIARVRKNNYYVELDRERISGDVVALQLWLLPEDISRVPRPRLDIYLMLFDSNWDYHIVEETRLSNPKLRVALVVEW